MEMCGAFALKSMNKKKLNISDLDFNLTFKKFSFKTEKLKYFSPPIVPVRPLKLHNVERNCFDI